VRPARARRLVIPLLLGTLVVIIAGLVVLWHLPVQAEHSLRLVSATGATCDVYLSGNLYGQTPLDLSAKELRALREPDLLPASWPPPNAKKSAQGRLGRYVHEEFLKEVTAPGRNETTWYCRYHAGKLEETFVLRIRVVDEDDRDLRRVSSRAHTEAGWTRIWRRREFFFGDPR